ncbi:MAG: hypothetical protein OEL57_16165, partial [Trichlorobacter sp.]|uniref:hypothetical protein n=1 Tax=Trichlorobacter sp. TaxID=2911007 RepID=UPI002569B376
QLTKLPKLVDGQNLQVSYSYNNDNISSISHNGFSYFFESDVFGRARNIKVGTQEIIRYLYDQKGNLTDSIFGNGQKTQIEYDKLNQIKSYKIWNDSIGSYETKFSYQYDAAENLGYLYDSVNEIGHRYIYDAADQLIGISSTDGSKLFLGFDPITQAEEMREDLKGESYTTRITNDMIGQPISLVSGKTTVQESEKGIKTYEYDSLGRVAITTLTLRPNSMDTFNYVTSYNFKDGINGSSSDLVDTMVENGMVTKYKYDKNSNIELIEQDGKKITYTYNEISELIREDNEILNKTIVYSYDAGGNILNILEYAYTTGALGVVTKSIPYVEGYE